jgi:CheY-like chemotaxis protein
MNAVDMIEQAGHVVIEASNADEAIRILESRSHIEIVFSDVSMPGSMDGVRLLRVIRDRWPPVRLTLSSGKSLPVGPAIPPGGVFMPKPYAYEDVVVELAQAA